MKRHIPNILTCGNLTVGCLAVMELFEGKLENIIFYVFLSGLFDFFDGFAARVLKVTSNIGKDLDSLADMVSFGLVPSLVMVQMISLNAPINEWRYIGLIVAVLSAVRLAKFNNDVRQSDTFYGLPVPANALFLCALPILLSHGVLVIILSNWICLSVISIVMALMLVSDIKLIALKFKHYKWYENEARFVLVVGSIIGFVFFQFTALPFIILFYILTSLLTNLLSKKTSDN